MNKVFVVMEEMMHEADTVLRVFIKYADAVAFVTELEAENTNSDVEYDVQEHNLY